MNFIIRHKLTFTGILIGALAGFAYYHFIGCAGGSCIITSKPLNSTLYGALLLGLLFNNFEKDSSNKAIENNEQ